MSLESLYKAPTLPSNIRNNQVFRRIPDLFTSKVDGGQNHVNQTGFFSKIAEAGLALGEQFFFLEEFQGGDAKRLEIPIQQFRMLPESDQVEIYTADERRLTLKTRTYRASSFPYDGSDMSDLKSIRIFASTGDRDKCLSFFIVMPENPAAS